MNRGHERHVSLTSCVVVAAAVVGLTRDAALARMARVTPASPLVDSVRFISRDLDSLGQGIQDREERAFALASVRFFQDPEDAQGARPGFYQSSVKVFRLAADADSTNAEALYHLGLVLARKSYSGFGKWDKKLLRESVGKLQQAQGRAVGPFADLRSAIARELATQTHNLEALK